MSPSTRFAERNSLSTEDLFHYDAARFEQMCEDVLGHAASLGASDAAVEVSESAGLSVNVRKQRVETIEQTRDKGLSVTVYLGQRRGNASSSDFSSASIAATVKAAYDIANHTAEDPCAGLPEPELLAPRDVPMLDLFHPWTIDAAQAISIARRMERAALTTSPLITNSDGAHVSVSHGHFFAANSRGFRGGYPYSRHSLGCAPIAQRGSAMQRDAWYSSHRVPERLADAAAIGRYAAERALSRLGARQVPTCKVPVLFEAPLACGLLGHLVQAASGGALYRKASFLVDALGKALFPEHVDIEEDPHRPTEVGSSPFDDEGVLTHRRQVVSRGVLEGYFLSTYSARKLGMTTTGNAGGSHNLSLTSRLTRAGDDLEAMLRKLDRGLFVTDLMGHGINYVTGDYSRGASGYWVEKGRIVRPVEEVTIACSLPEMFRAIAAVGDDVIVRGNKRTGSVLLEQMSLAGS
ncbi:MAG: metalloprotease PmbA [Burkholderiales bacterium]|nr:MAG: metalloprotease PmbA [Burkholderiales bacterium]